MKMSFTRNDASAKSLDGGQWITTSGAFIGTITQAMVGVSDSGTQFVEIAFKDDGGALCFPKLFLAKKDGTEVFGAKILNALMVVCGLDKVDVLEAKVYLRDKNAPNGLRVENGYRMPALEKKHVGIVVQRENRIYQGKKVYQINLLTPFDPQTRKVAKEILENAPEAKLLDARLKTLKDKDSTGQAQAAAQPPAGHPATADLPEEDLPF